jgi:predicted short-subunit dehydrogenase-like oxidoreductase (DUF2520 family)
MRARADRRTGFAVVGPGRVGAAFARLWSGSGMEFAGFVGRDRSRTRAALRLVGSGRALAGLGALARVPVVLVAVPDAAIAEVARSAAAGGGAGARALWIHTSGALPAAELSAVAAVGARVGSIHPLCPVPTAAEGVRSLPGCACGIEGAPAVLATLRGLVRALGCTPVLVPAAGKPLYHAAAVMASNYVVALLGLAAELFAEAAARPPAGRRRPRAVAALLPLALRTLAQVARLGPDRALTGPLVRGDPEAVALHLRSLRACGVGEAGRLYRAAGEAALRILVRRGAAPADLASLRGLLRGARPRGGRRG